MDKKGFVLAEAIVTGVFVLGLFSFIAINILPLVNSYHKSINYDNLETVYLANTLKDELDLREFDYQNGKYEIGKNDKIFFTLKSTDGDVDLSSIYDEKFLKVLYEYFKISELYIITPNSSKNPSSYIHISRSMKEYSNYYYIKNIQKGNKNNKIMLVKFQNNSFAGVVIN